MRYPKVTDAKDISQKQEIDSYPLKLYFLQFNRHDRNSSKEIKKKD